MKVLTAKQFLTELSAFQTKAELENVQRFFRYEGMESKFFGVRMSNIFALAKQFMQMPLNEIEKLLESDYYEARMAAVSIMDFQARDKKNTAERKKELFDLYISKHSCINNWDLVDRSAPFVVGGYLFDKSRTLLYQLAKSKNVWERRTAIVATYFFIRENDLEDTFKIAEILVNDQHDLIQKAVGSWIREAGKRDKQKLLNFLDQYASTMPKVTLRYAIEKLDQKQKDLYKKASQLK
ncbi:DNA alkylation repair protein [Pedobacter punctiformis]|uniref:DNA alkylation repair protein n=1 Tax=Pedobacter punctiformis TaxID=3004097 RepID=A0ABT4LBK9_9SPHI|nr:DNA alkylation repair protein [Pedobacter sp. HCMS5-2]MCZ4245304.1 DNA alkylation repair protein [Pedobacter sp. HCMS5-2]